jgi:hypothetical protein
VKLHILKVKKKGEGGVGWGGGEITTPNGLSPVPTKGRTILQIDKVHPAEHVRIMRLLLNAQDGGLYRNKGPHMRQNRECRVQYFVDPSAKGWPCN